jgi:hypothetical protein
MRKGPLLIPDAEEEATPAAPGEPEAVLLPPRHVVDAGIAEFLRLARLHWPARESGISISFDIKNERQLFYTIGLVYMAMRDADDDRTG